MLALALLLAFAPLFDPTPPTCPDGMALVQGTHFEIVQRLCIDHRGPGCFAFFPGLNAVEGIATRIETCMDRYEWPNKKGELPAVNVSFRSAKARCEKVHKRLCTELEWELACEGESLSPFPYGDVQEEAACVNEKPYLQYDQDKLDSDRPEVVSREVKRLFQGEPSGSRPRCTSAFGISDLVGNVEEWVQTSRAEWKYPSSLKGGYWSKPWSGCRGTNDSHGPMFRFYETGFRCCAEPSSIDSPPPAAGALKTPGAA